MSKVNLLSDQRKWASTYTDNEIYGDIKSRALAMRKRPTRAEVMLWQRLRGKRMQGLRFRRQQPIGRFIVDFYCRQAQLVVEVDGSSHHATEAAEYDKKRTQFLEELGLSVLRFSNEQVIYETGAVLNTISNHLVLKLAASPHPDGGNEGGS